MKISRILSATLFTALGLSVGIFGAKTVVACCLCGATGLIIDCLRFIYLKDQYLLISDKLESRYDSTWGQPKAPEGSVSSWRFFMYSNFMTYLILGLLFYRNVPVGRAAAGWGWSPFHGWSHQVSAISRTYATFLLKSGAEGRAFSVTCFFDWLYAILFLSATFGYLFFACDLRRDAACRIRARVKKGIAPSLKVTPSCTGIGLFLAVVLVYFCFNNLESGPENTFSFLPYSIDLNAFFLYFSIIAFCISFMFVVAAAYLRLSLPTFNKKNSQAL